MLIHAIIVVLFNLAINYFSLLFVETENHKTKESYEYSLIAKVYFFRVMNYLAATFYVLIYYQIGDLKIFLYELIVLNQLSEVFFYFILPFLQNSSKINEYFEKVKEKSKKQKLESITPC